LEDSGGGLRRGGSEEEGVRGSRGLDGLGRRRMGLGLEGKQESEVGRRNSRGRDASKLDDRIEGVSFPRWSREERESID